METINDKLFEHHSCNLKFLAKEGFNTPKYYDFETYDDMVQIIKDKSKVYKQEGVKGLIQVVNTFDGTSIYFSLDNIKPTILRKIEWVNNSNGELIPTATFDTINIDSKDINTCSLKNASYLERLMKIDKMKIGDEVAIILRDDNIPIIISVLANNNGTVINAPLYCPNCNQTTVMVNGKFICENAKCEVKVSEKMEAYCDLFDSSLKPLIVKVLKVNNITTISGLKNLSVDEIGSIDLFNKIQDKQSVSKAMFFNLILPMNNGVRVMSEFIDNVELSVLIDVNTTASTITGILKTDPIIADSLVVPINQQLATIQSNYKHFNIVEGSVQTLNTKIFCLTNTMKNHSMKEYEKMIVASGGIIGNVTQKLDHLVSNETDIKTTKYKKVVETNTKLYNNGKTHSINILTEDDLNKMMEK